MAGVNYLGRHVANQTGRVVNLNQKGGYELVSRRTSTQATRLARPAWPILINQKNRSDGFDRATQIRVAPSFLRETEALNPGLFWRPIHSPSATAHGIIRFRLGGGAR